MILLTRGERARIFLFLRFLWTAVARNEFAWPMMRRFAYLVYGFEVFAPALYFLLLFSADWDPVLLTAGLILGTCAHTWHGVMLYLHRYLSHRAFKIRFKPLEWALGVFTSLSLQGYPLTWAFFHRRHHQAADTEKDPHSPLFSSLIWLYCFFKTGYTLYVSEQEFAQYKAAFPGRLVDVSREQYFAKIDRYAVRTLGFQVALFCVLWSLGGWNWVVYFQMLPVVVVHTEVCVFINFFSHRYGYRNFELKGDLATNHFSAGLTISEWQNNHHRFPASASNRVKFWELDVLYLILLAWNKLGLVSDLVLVSSEKASRISGDSASN